MPALERNIGAIWVAKQTAKGSPAATAIKKARTVSGNFGIDVDTGSEPYADGARFNSSSDYLNSVTGSGSAGIQGQSGVLAYLAYLMLGAETVTGVGPYTHVAVPAASSFWTTWWKTVGSTVVQRQRHNDCRITSLVLEGSTGQKVLRATPTIISLDPGEVVASDPVKPDDDTEPLLYTEAEASFTVNGVVIRGHSAFTITITDELTPYYADSVNAQEVVSGRGRIDLSSTILVDAAGLAEYNRIVYGTTTPTTGAKPAKVVPALGTYEFTMTRGATELFKVKFFGARFNAPEAPAIDPAGGAPEMTLAGGGRLVGANPMIELTTKNADAAYV